MIDFLKYTKFYYVFSITLTILSVVSLCLWGLNLGIDFKGGSLLEVEFSNIRPENNKIQEELKKLDLLEIIVQPTSQNGTILRFKDVSEEKHKEIVSSLENLGKSLNSENKITEKRFESVGPVIGKELAQSAIMMIILALFGIAVYVAIAFRQVPRPVQSYKYALATLIALFHDVLITCGVFSVLGHFYGIEVNIYFVVAILTVLGYSVNDTIVVFDRTRENLIKLSEKTFSGVVSKSLNQTLVRSINTSLTVIFVLIIIYFFGGESIKYFILALLIGVSFGTYSSIFVASPLLVTFARARRK
ncbi:MAG: protein translocase subunit SecF [Syntrophales bacterium]|nr:protein translocase subunit SecF [Syntrophales bacterium]